MADAGYALTSPPSHRLYVGGFPRFDGSGVLKWLNTCEEVFYLNNTPLESRVKIVSSYLDGEAQHWYDQYMRSRYHQVPFWSEFIIDVSSKFAGVTRFTTVEDDGYAGSDYSATQMSCSLVNDRFIVEQSAVLVAHKVFDENPMRIGSIRNEIFDGQLRDLIVEDALDDVSGNLDVALGDNLMGRVEIERDNDQYVVRENSGEDGCQVFDEMPEVEMALFESDNVSSDLNPASDDCVDVVFTEIDEVDSEGDQIFEKEVTSIVACKLFDKMPMLETLVFVDRFAYKLFAEMLVRDNADFMNTLREPVLLKVGARADSVTLGFTLDPGENLVDTCSEHNVFFFDPGGQLKIGIIQSRSHLVATFDPGGLSSFTIDKEAEHLQSFIYSLVHAIWSQYGDGGLLIEMCLSKPVTGKLPLILDVMLVFNSGEMIVVETKKVLPQVSVIVGVFDPGVQLRRHRGTLDDVARLCRGSQCMRKPICLFVKDLADRSYDILVVSTTLVPAIRARREDPTYIIFEFVQLLQVLVATYFVKGFPCQPRAAYRKIFDPGGHWLIFVAQKKDIKCTSDRVWIVMKADEELHFYGNKEYG